MRFGITWFAIAALAILMASAPGRGQNPGATVQIKEAPPHSLTLTAPGAHSDHDLTLGLIGSSTYSIPLTTPPAEMAKQVGVAARTSGDLIGVLLARTGKFRTVKIVNAALFGTATSGYWSASRPAGREMGEFYVRVLKTFEGQGITHVAVMLGANNCVIRDKSPESYRADMVGFVNDLTKRGYKVILMSVGVRQDAGGGTTPEQKMELLRQYNAALPGLADKKNVFLGDTKLYDWQKAHPETLRPDHIHQTDAGSLALAQMQAQAIIHVLSEEK